MFCRSRLQWNELCISYHILFIFNRSLLWRTANQKKDLENKNTWNEFSTITCEPFCDMDQLYHSVIWTHPYHSTIRTNLYHSVMRTNPSELPKTWDNYYELNNNEGYFNLINIWDLCIFFYNFKLIRILLLFSPSHFSDQGFCWNKQWKF